MDNGYLRGGSEDEPSQSECCIGPGDPPRSRLVASNHDAPRFPGSIFPCGRVQQKEDSKFSNEGVMATQGSNEIDIQFSHSQQGFRLLELPASLLKVVRSGTCVR